MDEFAAFLKILSDTNRLRIIALLSKRKMCVCELAFALGISQPAISRHLRRMKQVGLVRDEQDGLWTNYSLGFVGLYRPLVEQVILFAGSNDQVKNDFLRLEGFNREQNCLDLEKNNKNGREK